ncbi:inositol hexakisphosphate and diphosphoinositol-pentakisphosphate kinase isoform X4 [Teleopsis dalmanni]|uniref:inositol hexakisphosphate and diphosphoinositol-pentakisphosphate kinase isoform X4 n=1 Tax=Teleopsis dalmanni TaxID=139649 RepID=UPI0018CE3430|nr:inositol hexakisphosphate and diphosphoinositol-pentakisphosphate kinase isoform X4 [Teleopsis dalmanni]
MEWTWLKDWWRLKKLKARHQRHKKKAAANAAAALHDVDNEDEVDDMDENDDSKQQDDGATNTRRKLNKRRGKRVSNKETTNNDDGIFSNTAEVDNNDNDDNDYDNEGDEGDDFCFCDECLNGDTDLCESTDGMDSDCSTSSNSGKQVVVGICAMAKKTQSKPMKEILTRLQEFEFIKMLIFEEDVILKEPVENWPICDCLVSFHSKGFPLEKAIQYAQLRKPFVLNNLHMQYDIQDRRRVYAILQKEGIEIPRYAVLDRDSPDPKQHELIESEDHVEVNGIIFNKPFVEKPVSAEDHNIYIYYPTSAGGGSQRLFRKIGSRSSVYSPESRVRKTGSFIYEDFMPTDVYFSGTDVKVYTVGPDYAHAEARKSPALDGKVERDSEGKEIRYPVILNHAEKLISRKVCLAFKQTVCGFDLLRANGKSYVCDVNGFSFVKNSNKYYDDCAKILGNMILRELTPTLHIPWSVPFQLDDPPIVPTTFGKMMELRCVVAVIRHGDRTPKQKMKVEVRHPKFFEIFEKYDGYKHGHVKLKRPKQLQEILDIARFLLAEIQTKAADVEIEEKQNKLEQLKSVLEMYGHFSGINRKVQMKYQPKGRPRGSSSDDVDAPKEPSLVLILKWGGELTPAGRIQAEELGRIFRCMYPGGQGRQDYSGTQGLGLLRLHSTFRHDLKIYASDEGRVQMTAAAFAKGLLALEGELTPILVQMVKSANTNGLLDNDCDSSKYQNMAKNRLHELMQNDRDFTREDREAINPGNSISINQALDFVKNPVACCNYVHKLIKDLLAIISVKKDDTKTKDAILYHGETWDLMGRRWEKIEKDFSTKSKLYDISKIPDIYDCIKYDLQHNQHTLQYDQAEELYIYAKYLADIVIPQEYGLTINEKLTIGQGICTPLLKKIKADLQRNIEEVDDESVNRLNPHYSHGVASPGRHVRTRLYFTSESHVHSLLTVLRYGGLLNVLTDEQWRRAMDYISMVSELNYMSQIVIMLYEDPTKDPTSEERFHVELHFSPGVNCCVQKNLPPGPGFRPHSRNDSANQRISGSEDTLINPPRIDEENDTDESPVKTHVDFSPEEKSVLCALPNTELSSKRLKSAPIPIGSHHTVCGHEASDLAKRLNEELASQQQAKQSGSLEAEHTSDADMRSRSFDQRQQKTKVLEQSTVCPLKAINYKEFKEIPIMRASNLNHASQIRVTDNLTLYKIDSSTNELPLSDIDFSQNPSTPDVPSNAESKRLKLLAMQRMESSDEPDYVKRIQHLPKISPLATNERPLSCNCLGGGVFEDHSPHSHSKSLAEIYTSNNNELTFGIGNFTMTSFEDYLQISCSAPAIVLNSEFRLREKPSKISLLKIGESHANSPTASTLKLCKDLEDSQLHKNILKDNLNTKCNTFSTLHTVHSAPIIVDMSNPFKFPPNTNLFVNQFAPIAEISTQATNANIFTTNTTTTTTTTTTTSSTNVDLPTTSSNKNRFSPYYHKPHHHHDHAHQYHQHNLDHDNSSHNKYHAHHSPNVPNVIVTLTSSTTDLSNLPDSNLKNFKISTHTHTYTHTHTHTHVHNHTNNHNFVHTTKINKPNCSYTHINTPPNSISATTTVDGNAASSVTSASSCASVSSRRQRHSIAGQMSYMKMLGFGGFSKKMATSSNSLFSTAVISGSSSAPNLRDMIPGTVSSSVLEGFGGVPPIRPLETLHNALSLKQLDSYLQKMTASALKTPASSPPKNPSTPVPTASNSLTDGTELKETTPTNQSCPCCTLPSNQVLGKCNFCGYLMPENVNRPKTSISAAGATVPPAVGSNTQNIWSKQSSLASSTEPSSPAVSDSYSHGTPSGEMSISLTSTEGFNILPAAEELAKFFPQLDDDLNSVTVYTPMNADTLDVDADSVFLSSSSGRGDKSACLTPVSFGMDISMIANKGSMTLSVDGFDDEDETTLSAATTPSLPTDDIKLETCYCCPTHAEQGQPPDCEFDNDIFKLPEPLKIPETKIISSSPDKYDPPPTLTLHDDTENSLSHNAHKISIRKASDPVSPRIQKQISLFESGDFERQKEISTLHASINIPASTQQLKQDERLRKFENLTQSTSNSNFPFESNTLKRVTHNAADFVDVTHTQSCINLKSSLGASPSSSVSGSPQHKSKYKTVAQSCCIVTTDAASEHSHPGAIVVKEKFIEPPKRIARGFHEKTQSMDADFLFNEFLLVPARSAVPLPHSSSSGTSSASTSPSSRPNSRFIATKVVDDMAVLGSK